MTPPQALEEAIRLLREAEMQPDLVKQAQTLGMANAWIDLGSALIEANR